MNKPKNIDRIKQERALLAFVIFSTCGMAAMAVALLAGPLSRYSADDVLIRTQKHRISQLEDLHSQQEELLANANNPCVIERTAVANLNYVAHGATEPLPRTWPELQNALARIDRTAPGPPARPTYEHFFDTLASRRGAQTLLLLFGSALVLISLTCFHRCA